MINCFGKLERATELSSYGSKLLTRMIQLPWHHLDYSKDGKKRHFSVFEYLRDSKMNPAQESL
jgi:hypothetical protein